MQDEIIGGHHERSMPAAAAQTGSSSSTLVMNKGTGSKNQQPRNMSSDRTPMRRPTYLSVMTYGAWWDALGPLPITRTGSTSSIVSPRFGALHARTVTHASVHGEAPDARALLLPAPVRPATTPCPAPARSELRRSRRGLATVAISSDTAL